MTYYPMNYVQNSGGDKTAALVIKTVQNSGGGGVTALVFKYVQNSDGRGSGEIAQPGGTGWGVGGE